MKAISFPLVMGSGQSTVLIAAAVATGQRVLLVSPRVLHHARQHELRRQFPELIFPQCVTPQWVARRGVPPGVELCVIDSGVPTRSTSKFWAALRASKARAWVYTHGGYGL